MAFLNNFENFHTCFEIFFKVNETFFQKSKYVFETFFKKIETFFKNQTLEKNPGKRPVSSSPPMRKSTPVIRSLDAPGNQT